jgi:hypothetical protein
MLRRLFTPLIALILVAAVAAPAAAAAPDSKSSTRHDAAGKGRTVMRHHGSIASQAIPPAGTVGVVSSVGYQDATTIAIIGEVLNNTNTRRVLVEVTATIYDVGDNVVGTITDTVFTERLAYGSLSPFVLFDGTKPAGADTFTVMVSDPGNPITTPAAGLLGKTINPSTVAGDTRTYHGSIHNPTALAMHLYVAVTTYESNGDVIDSNWTEPLLLAAHGNTAYSIPLFDDPATFRSAITAAAWVEPEQVVFTASSDNYFDDVGLLSFRSDILWLADSGITTGCGPSKYCPAANVRRDEMASFLSRALHLSGTVPDAFTDDNGNIHEHDINLVANAGITSGCAAGKFCPAASVPRDQMASFLARAVGLTGSAPNAFTDDNGNQHEPNINLAAQAGITTGCGGTKYCPAGLVTRGQMAAFLHRAFD